MSAFDRIIGYDSIKSEMLEIMDILKNPEIYTRLGASLPSGIVLDGDPGLGKTLLATSFMEESGVPGYILRRNKETKEFIAEMNRVFAEAENNAPSIILLDDMDKFAPEKHSSEEFAVLQSLIDTVKGKNVFIIATVNDTSNMPDSLIRAGRFDRYILLFRPTREDGEKIVRYYVGKKPIAEDVNMDDTSKMLAGKTCAELDSVINFAAISAAHDRCDRIEMRHLVEATLREAYGVTDRCEKLSPKEREEIAYHEAGHAVISDVIKEGSVGLVSICSSPAVERGGFMLRCLDFDRRPHEILISLGGKAASELKYGKVASGTMSDLSKACSHINTSIKRIGTYGLSNVCLSSESSLLLSRGEIVAAAELERFLFKAKEILAENREFLDKLAAEICEKGTLLNSDVARIRATCTITPAVIG